MYLKQHNVATCRQMNVALACLKAYVISIPGSWQEADLDGWTQVQCLEKNKVKREWCCL